MMRWIFPCLLLALCLAGNSSRAQQRPVLKLANQSEVFLSPASDWHVIPHKKGIAEQVLVRLAPGQLLSGQDKNMLWQQALGGNDYLVLLNGNAAQLPDGAAWFATLQPQWKMDAALLPAAAGNGSIAVLVAVAPPAASDFAELLHSLQGQLLRKVASGQNFYEIQLPKNKLYQLAAWYGTLSVSIKANPRSLNQESKVVTRVENLNTAPALGGYGLQGEGMVIGVGDNASGLDHVDLRDRIINYNPWPFAAHGVHINGIVGGAGIMDPDARGFAPRATLIDHPYDNVWALTGEMQSSHGMSITNNSYAAAVGSCTHAGTYDGYAALLDSMALAYPDVLHVFAAGNDGTMTCAPYAQGFHTVAGTYQAAKNVLVVGNMHKNTSIEPGSSRGPVKDGRLKPEVCAVGTSVFSCKNDDTYQSAGGTSMASPQVAGLAALLSQRYKQLHGGALPPGDLLKAIIMNGASDLGNPGPDFIYGFGAINGLRSIQMLDSTYYFSGSVADGAVVTHTVNVPATASRMKVMLYWHDVPASILPVQKLVNDLDLEVGQGGTVYFPFVLDTSAAQLNQPAITGVDRINNVEQVVVEAPAAGSWELKVTGFHVPQGPQQYVLVYVFEDSELKVTYPHAGTAVASGDSLRIAWEAPAGSNLFTVEISTDGGAAWTVLSNDVDAALRNYAYKLPSVNSNNCLVRVSRNGTSQTFTTAPFVLHQAMTITIADSSQQCPGAFVWNWSSPGAGVTAFQILQKKGNELVPVDTVPATQTSYALTGLWQDSLYYVAVRPFINGVPGKQSQGLRRKPDDGACSLGLFQGDLALTAIRSPQSGRLLTSTSLGTHEPLIVRIWNLSPVSATNYTVFYQVGGEPVGSTTFDAAADGIAPAAYKDVTVAHLDLSAPGSTQLTAWVVNNASPDPTPANDSARKTVRQLNNLALDLSTPFLEDFESFDPAPVLKDTVGLGPDSRWDYAHSSDSGRLRAWVNHAIPISGNQAMSMDAALNRPSGISNLLMGTFNLSNYAGTDVELRASFDYRLHGKPQHADSNRVWIRGSDTEPWLELFAYDTTAAPGTALYSGSISLPDVLANAGQQFSASTQFLFGQKDTSLIAASDYGNGLTIDNFTLYRVEKDVMVKRIAQPASFHCGGNAVQPVTVVIYNTVATPQHDVPVTYRFNGGSLVTEIIPVVPGKDSIAWTFTPTLNLINPGVDTLDVFIAAAGDTYSGNDSILNYQIRVQPVVDGFPYLEDFEASDGRWYAEGQNSSWYWGAPNGNLINKAASGANAWMSNTGAGYNSNEHSYLYSPCFDISSLEHPVLSFSLTLELENCGATLCDYLHMDYSFDEGATWQKLGSAATGTNWYNDSDHQVWSQQEAGRWHVSSIPLPQPPPGASLRLRYALHTDPGANLEGAAVDDIHIFDLQYPIHEGPAGPVTAALAGDTLVRFAADDKMLAEVNTAGQDLGEGSLEVYEHSDLIAPMMMQYIFPRSFALHGAQQPADSITLRLYVLESEAHAYFAAAGCTPCTLPSDIYRLGATRYQDPDPARENGSLDDNEHGGYQDYNSQLIRWVPYDKGYYAEFKTSGFSEYWFNDGGLAPLPVILVDLEARNEGNRSRIAWQSSMENNLSHYELEKSADGSAFAFLSSIAAHNQPFSYISYDNQPYEGFTYYRLKMVFQDSTFLYSKVVKARYKGGNNFVMQVYPNPAADELTVLVSGSKNEGMIQLMDVSGRILRRQAIYYGFATLNLSSLAKGIYFLKYADGQHLGTVKVEKK